MRRLLSVLILCVVFLVGCDDMYDYTIEEFEQGLFDGKNMEGVTVLVEVDEVADVGAFGFYILAGETLNFVSPNRPDVEPGDIIVVEVINYSTIFGEYFINYKY